MVVLKGIRRLRLFSSASRRLHSLRECGSHTTRCKNGSRSRWLGGTNRDVREGVSGVRLADQIGAALEQRIFAGAEKSLVKWSTG